MNKDNRAGGKKYSTNGSKTKGIRADGGGKNRGYKQDGPKFGYKNETKTREKYLTKPHNNKRDLEENDDGYSMILGRNAVIESIKSGANLDTIYVASGKREGSLLVILKLAKENNLLIKEVDINKLNNMCNGEKHQGVIAFSSPYKYCELEDIINSKKGNKNLILILDQIEDPHNLGAILRSAEAFGVDGVVIPKRRSVGVTRTVYKSSAGAIEHVKVARVNNLNQAIDTLKKNGIWVYASDMSGENINGISDFDIPLAVVIGSEGNGVSKSILENSDKVLSISMNGKINSLNASVAAAVFMYDIVSKR